MGTLPLNNSEVDRIGNLAFAIHAWATDRNSRAEDIPALAKQYEEAVPLLLRGDIAIERVVVDLHTRSNVLECLDDTLFETQMKHQKWVHSKAAGTSVMSPEVFAEGLREFHQLREGLPQEKTIPATLADMRKRVHGELLTTAGFKQRQAAEDNDPLISSYKRIHVDMNAAMLTSVAEGGFGDLALDRGINTAMRRLVAAVTFEAAGSPEHLKGFLNAYLKEKHGNAKGEEVTVGASFEALRAVDAMLAGKGASNAVRIPLIDELRQIARKAGAQIDRGPKLN